MAYETGTATNRADLIAKIITFLTTNAALVAAGQAWQNLGTAAGQTSGAWLQGPGLSGTDQIIVGLSAAPDNVAGDVYNIRLAGAQGFSAATSWDGQVGKSRDQFIGAWLSSMPYWIVANGQRFVVVVKVSTTYHAMYGGKILPYGTPSQYGYPLLIGGSSSANYRWSDTNVAHRSFVDPGTTTPSMNSAGDFSAFLCYPDGAWYSFGNWYPNAGNDTKPSSGQRFVWPYQAASEGGGAAARQREMRENIDGGFSLLPLILHGNDPSRQVLGEMDGCYCVSGFGNAAENIITISGTDYLVVQNIFRTNRWNYWALKLA